MECVQVCTDNALVVKPQTGESVDRMRKNWDFWMDLPTTSESFSRIDDLDEKVGALETLLMDKANYMSTVCGDGACLGCGEKSIIHLMTSTVTAMMQPRVKAHLKEIDDLVARLDTHIRMKLAGGVDISNVDAIEHAIKKHSDHDLTLANLTDSLNAEGASTPIDPKWLRWVTQLVEKLKYLKYRYTEGTTGRGRAAMGITNSTGCTSVWGATYPYNPYPFPWANHLFQDSTSLAMGLFEGHMVKMAEGFKAIRQAKLELEGRYDPEVHDSSLPTSSGSSSAMKNTVCAHLWWPLVVTARCTTSAFRTCPAPWHPEYRSRSWCWIPRFTPTPVVRPVPPALSARWRI